MKVSGGMRYNLIMNTTYGLRAELQGYPWKDIAEEFEVHGIKIKVAVGIMEVGYDKQEDGAKAKKIAQLYLNSQSLRNGKRITADFNHAWRPNTAGGRDLSMTLNDQINMNDRLQVQSQTHQASITGRAYIVNAQMHDSASFTNDSAMVDKALKDKVLAEALDYFSKEVVNNDRPLYDVYKSVEVITKHLGEGGRKKLAALAGKPVKYVSDLMETTNSKRHAVTDARKLLEDNECKDRAKVLIEAYASTI